MLGRGGLILLTDSCRVFWLSTMVWCFVILATGLDWIGLRDGTTQGVYDFDDEIGWLDGRYSSAIWTWLAAA